MRILILSQYWFPENGVPQRRWQWLSEVLLDDGHQLWAVAPHPHYEKKISLLCWWRNRFYRSRGFTREQEGGVSILRSGFFPGGESLLSKGVNQASVALSQSFNLVRGWKTFKNEIRPDVVIGTVPALPTAAVTFLYAKLLRVPFVIDLRDAWPDLLDSSARWNDAVNRPPKAKRMLNALVLSPLKSLVKNALTNILVSADALIVTSSNLGVNLRQKAEDSVDARVKKIITVRNVFPFEVQPSDVLSQLRRPSHLNVLYAGTLGRAQNLQNAVNAAKLCAEKGVTVHLRFVGEGAGKNLVNERAAETGVDAIFLPKQPPSALAEHYSWADTALVHLTDWQALFFAVPSKTYELMELGIHVSGAVSGEAADIIRQTGAGDVVDPEDPQALATLWCELAIGHRRLSGSDEAMRWVRNERELNVPHEMRGLLDELRH